MKFPRFGFFHASRAFKRKPRYWSTSGPTLSITCSTKSERLACTSHHHPRHQIGTTYLRVIRPFLCCQAKGIQDLLYVDQVERGYLYQRWAYWPGRLQRHSVDRSRRLHKLKNSICQTTLLNMFERTTTHCHGIRLPIASDLLRTKVVGIAVENMLSCWFSFLRKHNFSMLPPVNVVRICPAYKAGAHTKHVSTHDNASQVS